MGTPKALLTDGGRTFLGRLAETFGAAGCDPIVVVTGPESEQDAARVAAEARASGASVVVNALRDAPQLESLRAAIRALPEGVRAVIASPVDSPGATAGLVGAMIAAAGGPAAIVVVSHDGRRGHPVLFGAAHFPALLEGELPEGARTLIRRHAADVVEIETAEPGVLLDIDTPEEYERMRGASG